MKSIGISLALRERIKDMGITLLFREIMLPLIPKPIRPYLRWLYHKVMGIKWLRNVLIEKSSLQKCQNYWSNPPLHNKPNNYLGFELRSQFLLSLIRECITKDDKILEIGCNVGRNLNILQLNGYKKLCGIEICTEALELLSQTYPNLVGNCQLYNSSIEDVIGSIPDQEYGAVFTLAVLEHIHPDSNWVFPHMVRITKKYLITIEDEQCYSWRHFPRNYKKVFESLGMRQVKEVHCDSSVALNSNFVARVFVHEI